MTCHRARNAGFIGMMYPRSPQHNFRFEWDRATGYSHEIVYYGPFGCSSSSWIVPNTAEENEYDIEPEEEECDDDS